MSLPGILIPGEPCFLAADYSLVEGDVYGRLPQGSGHTRARRVYTVQQWRVAFNWLLTPAQMEVIDAWVENDLKAYELPFSVYLKNLAPGHSWWKAFFAEPFRAVPINASSDLLWRVSGTFVLDGEAEAGPPDTSTLAVEFIAHLLGEGTAATDAPLAVEFSAHLLPGASLAAEITAHLVKNEVAFLLMETGDYLLLESGGRIRLES